LGSEQEATSIERPRQRTIIPISSDKKQSFRSSSTITQLARTTQVITTRQLSK
jgi:hypothetical protein